MAGGAVFVDTGASVTIESSSLEGNSATGTTETDLGGSSGTGGAIVVADTGKAGTAATTLTMTNVTLKNNTSTLYGGALSTDTTSPNLVINATGCTFESNSSKKGGAVEIKNGNCNSAANPTAVKLVFTNCTFTKNSTTSGTGGAIEIRSGSCAKFDGLTATDNTAKATGGAIYVTSEYSRLYLTGEITASNNISKELNADTFIHMWTGAYTVPPHIYTTHSSDAAWMSTVKASNSQGLSTIGVTYDLTTLP